MKTFDVAEVYTQIIDWTRNWFADKDPDSMAVLGMSGGKDSTITAKLLADALGPKRVIGVAMPDEGQGLNDADKICKYLGINYITYPINIITNAINNINIICKDVPPMSHQAIQNVAPRIRMTILYMIGQSVDGFVVNCDNACEWYSGFFTKFGDGAGDFSLLHELTVEEELALADFIGIPREWSHKTPDDGLSYSAPDEQKLGFTYHELSMYMRGLEMPCSETLEKIKAWHNSTEHKRNIEIPCFRQTWHTSE